MEPLVNQWIWISLDAAGFPSQDGERRRTNDTASLGVTMSAFGEPESLN